MIIFFKYKHGNSASDYSTARSFSSYWTGNSMIKKGKLALSYSCDRKQKFKESICY